MTGLVPQPSRVLGNGAQGVPSNRSASPASANASLGTSVSDNPYQDPQTDTSGGRQGPQKSSAEVTSLQPKDDPSNTAAGARASVVAYAPHEEEPSERTTLLTPSAPKVRAKVAPQFGRVNSGDPASFRATRSNGRPAHRRPWLLKISFFVACLLGYANFSFLILTIGAITSPFLTHNALPSHFGSMFLPIWLSLLALLTNLLALLAFILPNESPKLSSVTSLGCALCSLIALILTLAVGQLRHREGVLTFVVLGLSLASTIHAAGSALLVERYAPYLIDPLPPPTIENTGFTASLKRVMKGILSFLSISLPLVILHVAILAAFVLLTLTVILRSYDASLEQDGQLWKVNPWQQKRYGEGSISGHKGRSYNVHLACRGVEVQPIMINANANTTSPILSSLTESSSTAFGTEDHLAAAAAALEDKAAWLRKPSRVSRKTILIESAQGIPGKVGAQWVMDMLREGEFTSPDLEVRVCYWDRPGYGFSDNSPSSSIPHVVSALTQALELSGEIARLSPSGLRPSFSTSASSTPSSTNVASSSTGFILVADRYGALSTNLFAALHPRLVSSILYLSPTPPSLHYTSHRHQWGHAFYYFFTRAVPAWSTELGVWRLWNTVLGLFRSKKISTRESRVLSTERMEIRGEIMRSYLQEEKELHNENSASSLAWKNARTRYPDRPTIVLSEMGRVNDDHDGEGDDEDEEYHGGDAKGLRQRSSQGTIGVGGQTGYSDREWREGQADFVEGIVGRGLVSWEKKWNGDCLKKGSNGADLCRDSLLKLVRRDD